MRIIVLDDQARTLQPSQVQLEFFDRTRWRPVSFKKTDRGEHIGVFNDGFPGFTVSPGRTVTISVRLDFISNTKPNRVTANAAALQRRDGEGDWLGQSNAYPFTITGGTVERTV
ncbi:hypothetical protein J7I98_26020 [Streptomyces sp. ISL-98]|uniref:hypothetical protein n=1 Tax=Streptomyces sp. ISL-98 TaxID=2819192 RepID=UPI001BEAA81D|nr:hypothetical protein [Streptomyces sp. ISL-98]MBT2509272.1 hypothetical protein [Streptomyces sp. ISL-98]